MDLSTHIRKDFEGILDDVDAIKSHLGLPTSMDRCEALISVLKERGGHCSATYDGVLTIRDVMGRKKTVRLRGEGLAAVRRNLASFNF